MGIDVLQVDCSPSIEVWWDFFALFCLIACIGSGFMFKAAKNRFIVFRYNMETWNKTYEIRTNNDRRINGPIIAIEVINFLWAVIGLIINKTSATSGL